jgi:hypothetical protein
MDKKLQDILEELCLEYSKGLNAKSNYISQAKIKIKEMFGEENAGKVLYMDLCGRLIKRILEFNPDEHDIELNLCGIIEKAKQEIRNRVKGQNE